MSRIEYKGLPKVAIIGRPNVGKSCLFNRMLKRRKAIIESTPGVTRDRLYAKIRLNEVDLVLIDTGGITFKTKEKIPQLVYRESRQAIEEADLILLVCDVTSGITYQDEHVASILRKSDKKAFLVINKVDNVKLHNDAFIFFKLGLGDPHNVSALHGRGIEELCDRIAESAKDAYSHRKKSNSLKGLEEEQISIAVVGRPNVGKSSFVNCILNQERLLVDEVPGTTRDSVDVSIKRDGRLIIIVDTAGMVHKRKLKETVEVFSLARAKESIRRCDVALVLTDITKKLSRDDIAIIEYIVKQGRGCVLLLNKSDLVSNIDAQSYRNRLIERFRPLSWIPIIFTSNRNKQNILKSIDTACKVMQRSKFFIPTPKLNNLLERLQKQNPHPYSRTFKPKIFYSVQAGKSPPKLLLFSSHPNLIRPEYLRFIENNLRREFNLEGVPVHFELRGRNEEK